MPRPAEARSVEASTVLRPAGKGRQRTANPLWRRLCITVLLLCVCAQAMPGSDSAGYQQTLTDDGRILQVHISDEFTPAQRDNLLAWIDFISGSLRHVYGHWPRQEWRISVSPVSATGSDPIPWAQVKRGAVDRVEFYTAPQATAAQLKQEWTGYHELAHLLIPYRGWGSAWFSEGLATYYQGLLQARSGVITEQQAWQSLHDGFLRGQAEKQFDGKTLRDVSAAMRKSGGFMRVYWSGAWYFLSLDIRLRQQSGGRQTLDMALRKLNDCCADEHLSAPAMVAKLDELNEILLFEPMYAKLDASTQIPAWESLFASVGVSVVDGKVILQQEGPGARLRQQMTTPGPL